MSMIPMEYAGGGYEKIADYTANSTYFSSGTVSLYANKDTRHCIMYVRSVVSKGFNNNNVEIVSIDNGYNPKTTFGVMAPAMSSGLVITPVDIVKNHYNNKVEFVKSGGLAEGLEINTNLQWNY